MVDYVELFNAEIEVRDADDEGDDVRGWIQPSRSGFWWIRRVVDGSNIREFWMQDLAAVKARLERDIAAEAEAVHNQQLSLNWN